MFTRALTALVAGTALATSAHADVLEVIPFGGGAYLSVQAAIDAAQDGDIILLKGANAHPGFTVDGKSLEIIAEYEEKVIIIAGNIRIENLAPHQTVTLINFSCTGDPMESLPGGDSLGRHGLVVRQALGHVRLVDCTFRGADSIATIGFTVQGNPDGGAGVVATAADISFLRCTLEGGNAANLVGDLLASGGCYCTITDQRGGDGLRALNSNVSLYDVGLKGGHGNDGEVYGGDGGHGLALLGTSTLFASGSDFQGWFGGTGNDWVFSEAGDGGSGVYATAATTCRFLDSTFAGASGGSSLSGGPKGVDGQPRKIIGTVVDLAGLAHRLTLSSPVREQESMEFTLSGHPNDQVYTVFGIGDGSQYLAEYAGQFHVSVPWLQFLYVGLVPASGTLAGSVPVPELGPGVQGLVFRVQPFFVHGVGGNTLLGNWAPLVLLDGAF